MPSRLDILPGSQCAEDFRMKDVGVAALHGQVHIAMGEYGAVVVHD